jgi:hypothetical protein
MAVYDARYADAYRALYVDHPMWRDKHDLNLQIVRELLAPGARWLDLCCGQAWHFTQIAGVAKTGVDASAAQLARARADNPDAAFVEADVLACDVSDVGGTFDLVTCFWGAYGYLDDVARIRAFVDRAIAWTAEGGALYLELITPHTLAAFDASPFAIEHGCRVELRSHDGVAWSYHDAGGRHDLTSPPAELFEAALAPYFARVATRGVVTTMRQLVATGRSRERVIDR